MDRLPASKSWSIVQGDAAVLAGQWPEQSVQTIVTSPPYFGHRRYGDDDHAEVGREASIGDYVARLVAIFDKLRRLLRDDGTLWLNLGDTYRDKVLLGAPWRVAFAMVESGWRLRADIIWHKPNAMPSPIKSRPTVDHEYLFLMSRGESYYYDADAIREPHVTFTEASRMRGGRRHFGKRDGTPEQGKFGSQSNLHDGRWDQAFHPRGRNKRTVWSVPLGKCREAHFAVFPETLIRPCIEAGSPPGALVLDPFCGSGTTGVASLSLGRRFLGFELSPQYVNLAQSRLTEQAGKSPTTRKIT